MTIFIVALVTCAVAYHFEKKEYGPGNLTAAVQQDFNLREARILNDRSAPDRIVEEKAPSYFNFRVRDSTIVSWNTVAVDLPDSVKHHPEFFLTGRMVKLSNGYYFIRVFPEPDSVDPGRAYAFTLIPIAFDYPIDNQYFHSRFAASDRIPVTTQISTVAEKGAYAVTDHEGKPVFYLQYLQTADEVYIAGPWVWLLAIVALFSLVFWVHERCYGIGLQSGKPVTGWLILLVILYLFKFIHSHVSYPSGFLNATLFSPELLSFDGIRSLGDFLFEILTDLWCAFYLLAYVPIAGKHIVRKTWLDFAIRLVLAFIFNLFIYRVLAGDMRRLIIDSKISFEAGNFPGLTLYTFIGIFCLSAITITFLMLLGIINALLDKGGTQKRFRYRYLIFILSSTLLIYLLSPGQIKPFYWVILLMSVAGLLMIDAFGLPLQKQKKQYDLSITPSTYIWFAIICSWITLEIFYFNYSKEKDLRKVFARKQEQQDDGMMAYNFMSIAEGLQQDSIVRHFLEAGNPAVRNNITKYLSYSYLGDYSGKYDINIYYYDRYRRPLFAVDSSDFTLLKLADSLAGGRCVSGMTNVINVTESNHIYWFLCPLEQAGDTTGYIGFDIAVNKRPEVMSQRSFLEKKNNPTDQQYFDNYSFAIYHNNALWSQGGEEVFPYINHDTLTGKEFLFVDESLRSSTLLLKSSDHELIKVVYKRNLLTNVISLFSYVLGVLLVLAALVFLVRQLLFYPGKLKLFVRNFNFTIRSKVNLTILVTVFASLMVVGVITLSFLSNKYKENQRRNLQSLLLYYTQSILQFAEEQHYNFSALDPGFFSAYSDLSYKLNTLAEEQGADINLYNQDGKLIATSQLQLFRKGLISQQMQHKVFLSLRRGDQSELMIADKIGDLEYQSVYTPIRNKEDKILAYVNLPYYASKAELNNEISNVLVALINVYTLIFFLSGICAIIISNSIIRSFRLLIDQFRNIRLRHNEYIEWPYKDEIGILVKEYNAMMRKVEAMASRLASSEREAAWREIARQVAHEIKNPLTPMKLNIQYLQQAILSGRPDLDKLASRVSVTLIEQIENLNLIATEFSNFAKMPEASPEALDLRESLHSLVSLFQKDNKVRVVLEEGSDKLRIFIDKSYFLRVFTNLIQNAIQSVEDDQQGAVTLSYEQKDNNVVIRIEDNGCGIPGDMQEKLFLPYFTTKSSGTGLGLPMTKNMVEHSNGTIWFESVEHKGSVFYISFPVYMSRMEQE